MSAWDYFADSGHEFINRRIVLLCQNTACALILVEVPVVIILDATTFRGIPNWLFFTSTVKMIQFYNFTRNAAYVNSRG